MPQTALQVLQSLHDIYLKQLEDKGIVELSGVSSSSAKAFMVAGLLANHAKPLLWIVDDTHVSNRIVNDLRVWGVDRVFDLQINEEPTKDQDLQRARVMHFVREGLQSVMVVSQDDIPEILVPVERDIKERTTTVKTGEEISTTAFFNSLIDAGYEVAEGMLVTLGKYVKRGGIIDVFPLNHVHPIRVELDGDMVQSIRSFHEQTGELLDKMNEVHIGPIDMPCVVGGLLKYFEKHGIVVIDEVPIPETTAPKFVFLPFTEVEDKRKKGVKEVHFKSVLRFANPLEFVKDLQERITNGWNSVIFTTDKEKVWNLLVDQGFSNADLEKVNLYSKEGAHMMASDKLFLEGDEFTTEKKIVFPESFQNVDLKLLVITDHEIFGTYAEPSHKRKFNADVDSAFLATLNPGDLVVHIDHGIGRFQGVERKTVSGTTKEYLFLEYAKGDKLYVPVEQADKVNKYIGATGENAPQLTRLGSADWDTVSHSARKETLEIAKELLELYAKRETATAESYPAETDEIKKFAEGFPYVETPGQIRTIAEIAHDLARSKPMDRLVCGDVGFGKTEVAMRAAFQVVQGGKQVAILAPITILADQHYQTFKKRMAGWPIEIQILSRFRTPAEQKQTISELEKGMVDIVIGTHRVLQDDVKFKDLGLVIVDEEQRFGVKQKEKLKGIRTGVHILSLTATPIPRTLNFSLSGLRDISTITTPPPGRLPIATEVRRFSLPLIHDVIRRELDRGGQVYFLHNRVQTIESIAEKLRLLVPDAKFLVAHGQLSSDELEDRIQAFKNKEFDVLVSSTIIENGIDLPNANTLIVDQAEQLGLSQAYQLRGRVGRSKLQAYSYFLYHTQKLDDSAKKRLRAIMEATELGSGFQIAMRDLEIRGAGDILGAKQHGAINAIGISHFTRLLKKAIEDMKLGKTATELLDKPMLEATVELAITAYLPDDYITKPSEKLKFYQRLAGCGDLKTLGELREEIVERYGAMLEQTQNLLNVLELKIQASEAGVINVKEIHPDGKKYIELVLGKKVKPGAILHLLEAQPQWLVSGESLKIAIEHLGSDWFTTLRTSVGYLVAGKEMNVQNPKFKQVLGQ